MNRIVDRNRDFERMVAFFEHLKISSRRILMLDYDGTLAPFHIERHQAVPYPGVQDLLTRILEAGHTRIILVSGRRAHEVLSLLNLPRPVEVWGSHGWEQCHEDGSWKVFRIGTHAQETLIQINKWLASEGLASHVELKIGGLALHWRGLPAPECRRLRMMMQKRWHRISNHAGLTFLPFDGGVEIRVQGRSKGAVIQSILGTIAGNSAVAYLGDDINDEAVFAALPAHGLSVLVREDYRPTQAQVWLQPPQELLCFLRRWHLAASQSEDDPIIAKHGDRALSSSPLLI